LPNVWTISSMLHMPIVN